MRASDVDRLRQWMYELEERKQWANHAVDLSFDRLSVATLPPVADPGAGARPRARVIGRRKRKR